MEAISTLSIDEEDVVVNLRREYASLRTLLDDQERKVERVLQRARKNGAETGRTSAEVKELNEALEKSKASAKEADGRIRLLQYQLMKEKKSQAKSQSSIPGKEASSSSATAFEEFQLLHWVKSSGYRCAIAHFQLSALKATTSSQGVNPGSEGGEEEAELSVVQELIEEFSILNQSFLNLSNLSVSRSSCKPVETFMPRMLHQKIFTSGLSSPSSSSCGSDATSVTAPLHASPATTTRSAAGSASGKQQHVQRSAETREKEALFAASANSNTSHSTKGTKETEDSRSLASYLSKKLQQPKELSPVAQQSSASFWSPTSSIDTDENASPNMQYLVTIEKGAAGVWAQESMISPGEIKQLFRGFHSSESTPFSMLPSPRERSATTPATYSVTKTPKSQMLAANASRISSLGRSRVSFAANVEYDSTSPAANSTTSSGVKTISRLVDCGSFMTESTEGEWSAHTLTTEFELLHDMRAYEALRARLINIEEQPFMGFGY